MIIWPGSIPKCGRPTRTGTPCRAGRMRLFEVAPADSAYRPPACPRHATEAERAEHERVLERAAAWQEEYQRSIPVACHQWPVSEADLLAASMALDREAALKVMGEWQQHRCAVCGCREAHVEDHDHVTGLTRGFLCRNCNGQEPAGGDRFVRYRARNPASILGLTIKYVGPFWNGPDEPVPLDQAGSYVLAKLYGQRADA